MPPNPPSKAHGFAMPSMSLRDMQISKSEKKYSWPPPCQFLGTPLCPPPLRAPMATPLTAAMFDSLSKTKHFLIILVLVMILADFFYENGC